MTESSGLPPEQEAVRRLLADARHDGPPPPEVVARLDATLASLAAERERAEVGDSSPARVVDIGSRRRRLAGAGLLAAAAVVVAGVALGQVLPVDGSDESSAGSADSSVAERQEPEAGAGTSSEEGSGTDGSADTEAPESLRSPPATPFAGLPSLASVDADLDQQVLALRADATSRRQLLAALDALGECDLPDTGPAAGLVAAEVDGQSGLVVFRRPTGDAQGVEVYVCGVPEPVRTLTLPAP